MKHFVPVSLLSLAVTALALHGTVDLASAAPPGGKGKSAISNGSIANLQVGKGVVTTIGKGTTPIIGKATTPIIIGKGTNNGGTVIGNGGIVNSLAKGKGIVNPIQQGGVQGLNLGQATNNANLNLIGKGTPLLAQKGLVGQSYQQGFQGANLCYKPAAFCGGGFWGGFGGNCGWGWGGCWQPCYPVYHCNPCWSNLCWGGGYNNMIVMQPICQTPIVQPVDQGQGAAIQQTDAGQQGGGLPIGGQQGGADPVKEVDPGTTQKETGGEANIEKSAAQAKRFLKIKNESGDKLTVYVQYKVKTEDGDAVWMPGEAASDKALSFVLAEGEELLVENKGKKLATNCIRIWAVSEKAQFSDFRTQDVWIVPEQNQQGDRVYYAPAMGTFTFVFPKLEDITK